MQCWSSVACVGEGWGERKGEKERVRGVGEREKEGKRRKEGKEEGKGEGKEERNKNGEWEKESIRKEIRLRIQFFQDQQWLNMIK